MKKLITNIYFNGIGMCTDIYKKDAKFMRSWLHTEENVGWCGFDSNEYSPKRVLCGGVKRSSNIFYKKYKFIYR